MSPFDRAEQLLSRTLGRTFHENIRVLPQRGGRMIVSEDTTRVAFDIKGTLDIMSQPKRPLGEGNTAGDVGVIMGTDVSLSIEAADLVGKPPIKEGDRIMALDRAGRPTFIVAQKAPLGVAEFQWQLLPELDEDG